MSHSDMFAAGFRPTCYMNCGAVLKEMGVKALDKSDVLEMVQKVL